MTSKIIGRCGYCLTKSVLTREHIVPRWKTRQGFHEGNVIYACRPCNQSKGPNTLQEWKSCLAKDDIRQVTLIKFLIMNPRQILEWSKMQRVFVTRTKNERDVRK